jgi:molybdopterin/thiamine biosynthesis adenylyltransferase/nitroreductase
MIINTNADFDNYFSIIDNHTFKPYIFSATNKHIFDKIVAYKHVTIYDTLNSQLQELIKTFNPSVKLSEPETEQYILDYIHPLPVTDYGNWVYYPWSNRLVRTLPEQEFVKVRTSRNQYKITPDEQLLLQQKKIGIIGLSVGQSVAVTIALERISGKIYLADFDTLELNNLNRIRTGIHNIGIPKVISVAREIAEIDPYISVTCYPLGITENNIEDFFYEGGKMDLLIEESDGFDIKIISRFEARKHGIPVLMEASDKCMVDVERFDLEPQRPILHGLVEHLNVEKLKQLVTTEDKIPYMMDVLGIDTVSTRLKASMIEIDQTINTWPQLASAVTMGGGITADVARRILLGQFNDSGRYYVDIENIIGSEKVFQLEDNFKHHPTFSLAQAIDYVRNSRLKHTIDVSHYIETWLTYAIAAPTAGNNQPWYWVYKNNVLYVIHDASKSYCWSDTDGALAYLGIGAAIENLILAANMQGYSVKKELLKHEFCVAAFTFFEDKTHTNEQLFDAIKLRCTNRKPGNGNPISVQLAEKISAYAQPAQVLWKHDKDSINAIAEIVASVEKLRLMNPYGHDEFFNKEMRWNSNQINATKDGLDIATLELNPLDVTGLKVASESAVMQKIREWKGGDALKKVSSKGIKSAAAVSLLIADKHISEIDAGGLVQRFWLAANAHGLHVQPISAPVFYFNKLNKTNHFTNQEIEILNYQKSFFNTIFECPNYQRPLFLFRLMYADPPTTSSLRKPLTNCFLKI